MPTFLLVGSFLLSIFLKNRKYKRWFFFLGIGLLLLFTNEFLANGLLRWWEVPPVEFNEMRETYDVGIVLSGVTSSKKEPNDRVHFSAGADRVIHTFQLYEKGIIKKILVSGGSGDLADQSYSEAENLYRIFQLFGVSEQDIIVEADSKNTRENALFSAEILNRSFPQGEFLLITSAFHMRRSAACFDAVGIAADPFSTDVRTVDAYYLLPYFWMPGAGAIGNWTILFKEIAGYIVYALIGYI